MIVEYKSEISAAIQNALETLEVNLSQFAEHARVDKATIWRLLEGKQHDVHQDTAERLASILKRSASDVKVMCRVPLNYSPARLKVINRPPAQRPVAPAASNPEISIGCDPIAALVRDIAAMLERYPSPTKHRAQRESLSQALAALAEFIVDPTAGDDVVTELRQSFEVSLGLEEDSSAVLETSRP